MSEEAVIVVVVAVVVDDDADGVRGGGERDIDRDRRAGSNIRIECQRGNSFAALIVRALLTKLRRWRFVEAQRRHVRARWRSEALVDAPTRRRRRR